MDKNSNFNKIITSIDNLLIENKEQKFKDKLAEKIRDSIFTDEILNSMNKHDFSEVLNDEDNSATQLFDSIFPIFVKKNNIIFRLYKHKIEVDLSDEMKDRYIYILRDGRLTSGLFECFGIHDNQYVYGLERIIDVIPLFKKEILLTIDNYEKNINNRHEKIKLSRENEKIAEKNYYDLIEYLNSKKL